MSSLHPLRLYIDHFVLLTDDDWAMMEPLLSERTIPRYDCMIKEGSLGRELGFILEGDMRHYYTHAGEERTTYFYFENMLVGPYMSCITGKPSQITIEALSDTRMMVFPYSGLVKLFTQSKAWERFGRVLAEYLAIGLEERMVGLLMLSPEERYIELISGNKKRIVERIPQQHIANYLGITPVSLSRIRNRLAKK